jgi:hypothetical protein
MSKASLSPLFVFGGLAALGLVMLGGKKTPPASSKPISAALQAEIATTLQTLGVDENGVAHGPIPLLPVQRAILFANELERAGYPEAFELIRGYVRQLAPGMA